MVEAQAVRGIAIARPRVQLRGVRLTREPLAPGASRLLSFTLTARDLSVVYPDGAPDAAPCHAPCTAPPSPTLRILSSRGSTPPHCHSALLGSISVPVLSSFGLY